MSAKRPSNPPKTAPVIAQRDPPKLSRRRIVAALGAVPILAVQPSAVAAQLPAVAVPAAAAKPPIGVDPAVALCLRWLETNREQERLHRRWGRVESWLADHHRWFKLSKEEQLALPEAQRLYDIDARLEALGKQSARQLRHLRKVSATSLEGAICKFSVVATVIEPDDYPSAHRVLVDAIADLKRLQAAQSA